MPRRLTFLAAVLALAGCDFGGGPPEREAVTAGEATSTAPKPTMTQAPPTPTELVVQAIRACEVKRIVFLHDDTTSITYRGGRTVALKRVNPWAIQRAAERRDACDVVIGIE